MMTRKLGNTVSPVVELTKSDDGKLVLSSNSTFKNSSIAFKLNEEFDEETPDGRKVKSLIVQDGNKLVHTQKCDKHSDTTIVREFEPEQLKMVKRIIKSVYTRGLSTITQHCNDNHTIKILIQILKTKLRNVLYL